MDHVVVAVLALAQRRAVLLLLVALAVLFHAVRVLAGAAFLLARVLVVRLPSGVLLHRKVRGVVPALLALAQVRAQNVAAEAFAVVLEAARLLAVARLSGRRRPGPGLARRLHCPRTKLHYRIEFELRPRL